MKKLFLMLCIAVTFGLTACAYDGRPITFEQLPANAQLVITQNFVKEWKLDDGQWKSELNNGLELIFNRISGTDVIRTPCLRWMIGRCSSKH